MYWADGVQIDTAAPYSGVAPVQEEQKIEQLPTIEEIRQEMILRINEVRREIDDSRVFCYMMVGNPNAYNPYG